MFESTLVDELPPELGASLNEIAERAAGLVAAYLGGLGFRGSAGTPLALPASFLLDLGAALCLVEWEERGVDIHLRAGLPAGRDAVGHVMAAAVQAASPHSRSPDDQLNCVRPSGELIAAVCRLVVEELAWTGRPLLGTDVVLGAVDDAILVECAARLLWQARHLGRSSS